MKKSSKTLHFAALWAGIFLSAFGMLRAQVTWTGGGSNNNTATTANWGSGAAPTTSSNSSLIFSGTTRLAPDFNPGNWNVNAITFASGAGAFTLSDGGLTMGAGGITNNSASSQTINNQITVNATQTWNAAGGNIIYNGYIGGNNQTLTVTGAHDQTFTNQVNSVGTLNVAGSGDATFSNAVSANTLNLGGSGTTTFTSSGSIQGAINVTSSGAVNLNGTINNSSLTLNGTGTTSLNGSGSTNITSAVVNNGTLVMNRSGTGANGAINGSLTVNNGGTVVMGANNQIPNWQSVTLNQGSTLSLGNTSQTFATLNITGDTKIDFGSSGSQLNVTYGGITIANNVTVTIVNWNSSMDVFTGNNPGNNVVNVQYVDSNGNVYATGTWGSNQITPTTPVPEPRIYGLILMLIGFAVVTGRKWLKYFRVFLRRLKHEDTKEVMSALH